MDFKCPNCGTLNDLVLIVEEKNSTRLCWDEDSTDFEYGKEERLDCTASDIVCANCEHVPVFKSGAFVTDFNELKQWLSENPYESDEPDNPFALYMNSSSLTEKDIKRAKEVSTYLVKILNKLIEDIKALGNSNPTFKQRYYVLMVPVANQINALEFSNVGVGDTETDECICSYLEKKLEQSYDAVVYTQMGHDFYEMIH